MSESFQPRPLEPHEQEIVQQTQELYQEHQAAADSSESGAGEAAVRERLHSEAIVQQAHHIANTLNPPAGQEVEEREYQRYDPADFDIAPPAPEEAESVREFMNHVIAYNRQDDKRQIQWSDYEPGEIEQLIEKGQIFVVKSNDPESGGVISGAVILNDDFAAWEDDLPERSLHFSKFAGAPELKGFGSDVLWPKMVEYAQDKGYQNLVCEAFDVEGLDKFYRSVGMQALGPHTYVSGYYGGKQITANRYMMNIERKAQQ